MRLSLRQADILEALATDEKLLQQGGGVPDVQQGETKYVLILGLCSSYLIPNKNTEKVIPHLYFIPNLAVSCSRLRRANLGALDSKISLM